jgi:hypothetical protein
MNEAERDFMDSCLMRGVVSVRFTKADGSERLMRCTKDFDLIPLDQHPVGTGDTPVPVDLEKVFDLDIQEWRSFKPSRVLGWSPEV